MDFKTAMAIQQARDFGELQRQAGAILDGYQREFARNRRREERAKYCPKAQRLSGLEVLSHMNSCDYCNKEN